MTKNTACAEASMHRWLCICKRTTKKVCTYARSDQIKKQRKNCMVHEG